MIVTKGKYIRTDEIIKRQSDAHIGIQEGENNPMHGKNHSSKSKELMGTNHADYSGSKHPQWKGGTKKYWNLQCKIRDDYTCQICGHREPEIMETDHILPQSLYPELKFEINNLITLCPNCHMRKTNRERRNKEYIEKE